MINSMASRAWRHAVGAPLERGVRHRLLMTEQGAALMHLTCHKLEQVAETRDGLRCLPARVKVVAA